MVKSRDVHFNSFPFLLVRLPSVPRSILHELAYEQTLTLLDGGCHDPTLLDHAFATDSERADPAAVALLQRAPFLSALEEANLQLALKVRALPFCASTRMVKKQRQTVRTALRYLWRAALRPVPCGLLCGTALGVIDANARNGLPTPDLRHREGTSSMPASRVHAVARTAWIRPAAARRSRLYLSPLCWIDDRGPMWLVSEDGATTCQLMPDRFHHLARILHVRPTVPWAELLALGLQEEILQAAVEGGFVGQCAGDAGDDEPAALTRLLWEAVPEDIMLLSAIDANTFGAGRETPTGRRRPVQTDSCYPSLLRLTSPGMNEFLQEVTQFGCRVAGNATLESRIFGELFQRFSPAGEPKPILEFYSQCAHFGRRHGVSTPENIRDFAAACHIDDADPTTDFAVNLLFSCREARGPISVKLPEEWSIAPLSTRRACMRFRRATDGPFGPRYHLVYFGADRMSLLARYARLPYEQRPEFVSAARQWLASWPELSDLYGHSSHDADAHDSITRRVIHCGGPPPLGGMRLADLKVARPLPNTPPFLIDSAGMRVQPAFFGVAAEHTLPPVVRFALAIGNPERTILESVCRALHFLLLQSLMLLDSSIAVLPELTLGRSIVLSPQIFLIPAAALPHVKTPVARMGFSCFQNWLCQTGLPRRLIQLCIPMQEPQWLDLGHPEGVNNFFRIARSNEALILSRSFLNHDNDGLHASDGWYEPEYYAEVGVKEFS